MGSKPFGTIYLVTNLIDGRYYVGQTTQPITTRWSIHKSAARNRPLSYLHKAIRLYGPSNFYIEPLGYASNRDDLNRLERAWILVIGASKRNLGYNLTSGGESPSFSASARAKMSKAKKGKPLSEEHKRKLSEVSLGRKQTRAHIAARAAALKGRRPSSRCILAVIESNKRRAVNGGHQR